MKAMILAAGVGSRLQPLTKILPKPLIPLLNIPLLDYTLQWLQEHGVQDVMINLHHLPTLIPGRYGNGATRNMHIHYSYESELLGSAGAVRKVEEFWEKEPLLVIHGDVLLEIDLNEYIHFHQEEGAIATLALVPFHRKHGYGIIRTDEEGRIQQFLEATGDLKGTLRWGTFSGMQILEPEIRSFIPPHRFWVLTESVYPELVHRALPFFGYYTCGDWADLGTPERYLETHFALLTGRFSTFTAFGFPFFSLSASGLPRQYLEENPKNSLHLFPPILVGQDVQIGEEVTLGPFVVIGNNCRIGDRVSVVRSVLWDDVVLEEGALVQESILGSGVRIAAGSRLVQTERVV